MTERDELRQQAADPATPLATLHRIAQERPDLRAALAANPSTYPALLEWLGTLGDPEVDAALAGRGTGGAAAATPVAGGRSAQNGSGRETAPATDPEATAVHAPVSDETAVQPAVVDDADETTARPAATDADAETTVRPAATDATVVQPAVEDVHPSAMDTPRQEGTGRPAAQGTDSTQVLGAAPAGGAAPPSYRPDTDGADPTGPTPAERGPSPLAFTEPTPASGVRAVTGTADPTGRGPMWAVLGLVALILIVGAVWIWSMRGDNEPDLAATTSPEATSPAEQEAEPSPDEEVDAEEQALAEARSELAALPENTTCADPATDATVINTYGTAAAPGGEWEQQSDEAQLLRVLTQVQERCDVGYVLEVREAVAEAPEASPAVVTTLSTAEWADIQRPAPEGAVATSEFASPSGNIACDLGVRSASCTIEERSFPDPATCDGGPVTVVVPATGEASIDCGAPTVQAADGVLDYGQAASAGVFACTSAEDGVTCWSTLTGRGFSLARAGVETF